MFLTNPILAHAVRGPAEAQGATGGGLPSVLDPAALARLQELDPGGQAGLVQRVLTTYVNSLDKLLAQWAAARTAGDAAALRHVAHTLKSSSASVGALTLSGLCAEVERALREGETAGLEARLEALTAEAMRILGALRAAPGAGA
jgi:HPt (histidine-containing phosphotransfer) domain-containing protein